MSPRLRLRRHLQDLERARDSLAQARASGADPWRVAELQLRYDRLNERAFEAEFDPDGPPAARTRAEYPPLGPTRRPGRG